MQSTFAMCCVATLLPHMQAMPLAEVCQVSRIGIVWLVPPCIQKRAVHFMHFGHPGLHAYILIRVLGKMIFRTSGRAACKITVALCRMLLLLSVTTPNAIAGEDGRCWLAHNVVGSK